METNPDLLFGALAIKNGFASESEVELALDAQKQADPDENQSLPKVGEILVEMGTLTPEKVQALLVEQACLRKGAGAALGETQDAAHDPRPSNGAATLASEEETASVPPPAAPDSNPEAKPADGGPGAAAEGPAPGAPPATFGAKVKALAAHLWDKLRRLFRDMSGKRAKEKAQASEKRDELLLQIGEACLRAKVGAPEADSAAKAQQGLEAARQKLQRLTDSKTAAPKDLVAAKTGLKSAESKHKRAMTKLGRSVIEKNLVPEGEQAKVDEVRALDEKVKDLT